MTIDDLKACSNKVINDMVAKACGWRLVERYRGTPKYTTVWVKPIGCGPTIRKTARLLW
jgi:hypothetical protein